MARPRTPVAKAKATAADVKNPGRHRSRKAPKGQAALGGPSAWLSLYGKRAFEAFKRELPWLKESHRLLVELGAQTRGKLMDPEVDVVGLQERQELRRILAQLGATPADESKVNIPDAGDDEPEEALFKARAASAAPPRPH